MAIQRSSFNASAITAFQAAASVTLTFPPKSIQLVNLHATEAVDVSLDGTTVHYTLTPGTLTAGVILLQRVLKIWFRRSSASGSPTGVLIQTVAED